MEKDYNDLWLNPKKPYSIAHRGASTYYLENTLESFLFANTLGADFWEVDIQITKDNQLIVFHDSCLPTGENIVNLYFSEVLFINFDITELNYKKISNNFDIKSVEIDIIVGPLC